MSKPVLPVFFHPVQLSHKPLYEWAFGTKLEHPETTTRAEKILAAIGAAGSVFALHTPSAMPEALLKRLHDPRLVTLYRRAEQDLADDATFYPSVFPKRHQNRPDPESIHHAGFFCFDSGTPLTKLTWAASAWSAACAHDAAKLVASGKSRFAYALSRPPGHHASRDLFGGYCYFNNAALAVAALRERGGKVAIVDIDFHHGNGTQAMFYRDPEVLFVSIHGDPREFYPYFSGFATERGAGDGEGFTLNHPLPKGADWQEYARVLDTQVLPAIRSFGASALIVSAGFDTYRDDPIGRFTLETDDFATLGGRLASLGLPTVIVQEGGYCVEALGANVAAFLEGAREG